MNNHDAEIGEALDAFTADSRSTHRACVRLLARLNPAIAQEIRDSHSAFYERAGRDDDPATRAFDTLLVRLGPIAQMMPRLAAATAPMASLWAATGRVGDQWLVIVPAGVVSFYRAFCTVIFVAKESVDVSPELEEPISRMAKLLGAQLECGLVDFNAIEQFPAKTKPLLDHVTQIAYEFFLLHEACHVRERHIEPDPHSTTWYQEAHQRHANEFAADRWAFQTLLSSFSKQLYLVAVSIALLFDALDLLERFNFSGLKRLTHPSPCARKWRLMRLLESPERLHFLNPEGLDEARQFSMLYERLSAFIVDRACPETPLNIILNRTETASDDLFVERILTMMGRGNPDQVVHNLANVRRSSAAWASQSADDADAQFALAINRHIDALGKVLTEERALARLGRELLEAGTHA